MCTHHNVAHAPPVRGGPIAHPAQRNGHPIHTSTAPRGFAASSPIALHAGAACIGHNPLIEFPLVSPSSPVCVVMNVHVTVSYVHAWNALPSHSPEPEAPLVPALLDVT